MKVHELITLLQSCDPELEVYGVSDHGQCPEKACDPCLIYLTDNVDSILEGFSTCEEEAEDYGYKFKAILL